MKSKKKFGQKMLLSIFVVAILLFSTNAGAAINKIEKTPELETQTEPIDETPLNEEPAGLFFTIVKVSTYYLVSGAHAPCFRTVRVYKGDKLVRKGFTWLFGNTFFFGLQAGQEYKFSAIYYIDGVEKTKSVTQTIDPFFDSVNIKMGY